MVHTDSCLKYINDEIGYGVFATAFIPKGSITYVKDDLDLEINSTAFEAYPELLKQNIEKYSYIDERGIRIVSWDFAKYVNHCCHCNTMSTGYGFEIAIRDIQSGEEITDEYGLFNLNEEISLNCQKPGCRIKVGGEDLENYYQEWDMKVKQALLLLPAVNQPLINLLDSKTRKQVFSFLQDAREYKSVRLLKCFPNPVRT